MDFFGLFGELEWCRGSEKRILQLKKNSLNNLCRYWGPFADIDVVVGTKGSERT
jgi:hypothetical protein